MTDVLLRCATLAARESGVPSKPDEILDAVGTVAWSKAGRMYDWRNYVPLSIRESWPGLSLDARLAVFVMACELASSEDPSI